MKDSQYADILHQVTYRYVGGKPDDGILSCGFMRKMTSQKSQIDYIIPYYSCFILLEGSGEYWDETGVRTLLHPGSVVQRLPNRVHSTRVVGDGKWLEFFISFGKSTFDSLTSLNLLDATSTVGQFSEPELQIPAFKKLLSEMSSTQDNMLGYCLLEAQQLVMTLNNHHRPQETLSHTMAQACALLEKDLKKEVSLDEIAKQLCIGYESFRKQFQREMKVSPDNYRNQKRMITAQMMLMEGESVKAVAKVLGYSDAYAFSKQFKRYYGCAPTAIRTEKEV